MHPNAHDCCFCVCSVSVVIRLWWCWCVHQLTQVHLQTLLLVLWHSSGFQKSQRPQGQEWALAAHVSETNRNSLHANITSARPEKSVAQTASWWVQHSPSTCIQWLPHKSLLHVTFKLVIKLTLSSHHVQPHQQRLLPSRQRCHILPAHLKSDNMLNSESLCLLRTCCEIRTKLPSLSFWLSVLHREEENICSELQQERIIVYHLSPFLWSTILQSHWSSLLVGWWEEVWTIRQQV